MAGVLLDDGRVVRFKAPDWEESDPRWDMPRDDLSVDDFEELVDGEWTPVSEPVSCSEYFKKSSPFPEDVEPWD